MELAPDDKQHSESSFIQRQTEVILILSMNSFYGKNIAELKDILKDILTITLQVKPSGG